ncbi:MAG: ABC transporter permease [Saprospiraceae bacterium]|nr:ABC transporter permease [Saprospiraceae bacterium]
MTISIRSILRQFSRNKWHTSILVGGLALGIAAFVLIAQYITDEWQSNKFHARYDQLHRLSIMDANGEPQLHLPPGYKPLMENSIPGIKSIVRTTENLGSGIIQLSEEIDSETKVFREEDIIYVDQDYLSVFTFPVLAGSDNLSEPHSVALASSVSKKIFGKKDPIGQTLTIDNQFGKHIFTVKSVFQDPPSNSDLQPKVLLSMSSLNNAADRNDNDWADPAETESSFIHYFLLLDEGTKALDIQSSITTLMRNASPDNSGVQAVVQAFSNLHLAPSLDYPYPTFGSLKLVLLLSFVALLILCIAWINYINLSTVQAIDKAKGIMVRKIMGAGKKKLMSQQIIESLLLCVIGTAIALVIVQVLQPTFNSFTGKSLSLQQLFSAPLAWMLVLMLIAASIISGSYIGVVLNTSKPVQTMRGNIGKSISGLMLRRGMVVFQFTISVIFIVSTLVLYRQLQFMKSELQGLSLEQLLVIQGPTNSGEEQAGKNVAFKNALGQIPFVVDYCASNNVPGKGYNFGTNDIKRVESTEKDEIKNYKVFISDEMYFDTYNMELLEGKVFSRENSYDGWGKSQKLMINESAAKELGFTADKPIAGSQLLWDGSPFEITGVVKDYNHLGLQQAIEPVIFVPSVSFYYFTVKMNTEGLDDKIAELKSLYAEYFPTEPFEFFFAEENYDLQYRQEQQLGAVFISAAILAILIACLGLFGLVMYTTKQRTKEIGIRKVLGASIISIVTLLSGEFIRLVILALIIGLSVGAWGMSKWLENFEYRTEIGWDILIISSLLAFIIALVTVSWQAFKSALADPAKSIRND